MTFEQAVEMMTSFQDWTSERFPTLTPNSYDVYAPPEPFAEWGSEWPSKMPRAASGLYFLLWPDDEIVYVGKGTQDNIAGRFWAHLNNPTHHQDGRFELPDCRFLGREGLDSDLEEAFRGGQFRVAAVAVEPAVLASLLEAWVQTLQVRREGALPTLNLQIC